MPSILLQVVFIGDEVRVGQARVGYDEAARAHAKAHHAMPLEVSELLAVDIERDLAMARDVPGKSGQSSVLSLAPDRPTAGAAVVVEGFVICEEGGVAGEERVAPRAGRAEE